MLHVACQINYKTERKGGPEQGRFLGCVAGAGCPGVQIFGEFWQPFFKTSNEALVDLVY